MSAAGTAHSLARPLPLGAIFGGIAAAGVAAVGVLHLDRLPFPVCYLKALTGLPCPTCGATRAMARLFALDLGGAFVLNPLATMGALGLVAWAMADLLLLTRGRPLRLRVSPSAGGFLRVGVVLLVLANWVYLVVVGR